MEAIDINLAMFVLRVVLGLTFAYHGLGKARSLEGTSGWFESMGMRPGKLHGPLAAYTEIGSGLLLAAGLLTPLAALAIVAVMAVAAYTVHRHAFLITKEGFEYTMIIAVAAVAVATVGPGEWSIDEALGISTDFNGVAGFLIAAVGGVGAAVAQLAIFYRPPSESTS